MKFGYTIVYVQDVKASLAFFERAFGLKTSFLDEVAGYGELDTGSTALAFASHALMADLLPGGYVAGQESARPPGVEIGSPWWVDRLLLRQPVKRVLKTALLGTCAPACRFEMLSLYQAEKLSAGQVEAFRGRIRRALGRWG